MKDKYRSYYAALGSNPFRLWQLTGTEFVLADAQSGLGKQLIAHPSFSVETYFDFGRDGVKIASGAGRYVLLRIKQTLPKAIVYHRREVLDGDAALKRIADPKWNPFESVVVSTNVSVAADLSAPTTTAVTLDSYEREKVVMSAELKSPGVLLLNDYNDPRWSVFVDGEKREMLTCNYLMRGVELKAGKHKIEFRFSDRKQTLLFGLIVAVWAVLGVWWIVGLFSHKATKPQSLG